MRTMPMIWDKKGAAPAENPCAVCGKELNPKKMWGVIVVDGGVTVVHPGDEGLINMGDPGYMGTHFVGSECRKKFGEFAFPWRPACGFGSA